MHPINITAKITFRRWISLIIIIILVSPIFGCADTPKKHEDEKNNTNIYKTLGAEDIDSLKDFLLQIDDKFYDNYDSKNVLDKEQNIIAMLLSAPFIWNFDWYKGDADVHWYYAEPGIKDPRGNFTSNNSFAKCSVQTVDWVLKNIFNISASDTEKLKKDGESKGLFYIQDSYYYCQIGGIGWLEPYIVIKDIYYDDEHCYVSYDYYNSSDIHMNDYVTEKDIKNNLTPSRFCAVLEYKIIGGERYWSLDKWKSDSNLFETKNKEKLDVNIEPTFSDWYEAYKDFLLRDRYLSEKYGLDFTVGSAALLKDMDDDKIPELLITNGMVTRAQGYAYGFTYSDNKVIYLGICPLDAYSINDERYPGIVGRYNDMGVYNVNYYKKNGDKIEYEPVCEERIGAHNADYIMTTEDRGLYDAYIAGTKSIKYTNVSKIKEMGFNEFLAANLDFSKYRDNTYELWNIEHSLDESSYKYNSQLSAVCAGLIVDAVNEDNMKTAFSKMGFSKDRIDTGNYSSIMPDIFEQGCYGIASMNNVAIDGEMYNILVITARGTKSKRESLKDFTSSATKDFFGYNAYDVVYDIYESIMDGVDKHIKEHPELKTGKLKVVVTGHSLGGAVANLVGAAFTFCVGDSNVWWGNLTTKQDIYCYTFGAINSIDNKMYNSSTMVAELPVHTGFENIHNSYNWYDTWGPNRFGSLLINGIGTGTQKFGHFHFFEQNNSDDSITTPNNHWESTYYDAAIERKIQTNCNNKWGR